MQNINYTFLTTQDWNSRMSAIVKKYSSDPNSVDLSDATCPICLCLYMSPVKLPCDHVLCEGCFTSTVNNTNLVCPICRKRISVWCRNASKVIFWSVLYTQGVHKKWEKGAKKCIFEDVERFILTTTYRDIK